MSDEFKPLQLRDWKFLDQYYKHPGNSPSDARLAGDQLLRLCLKCTKEISNETIVQNSPKKDFGTTQHDLFEICSRKPARCTEITNDEVVNITETPDPMVEEPPYNDRVTDYSQESYQDYE
ncbi:hypothetical protein M9Y10_002008 [Tritrichomonas musculus]|uniref:Uncharacterized protein n=1 Tax=Tritrichomonas musculus TaxID=1915356 RepID=A0ABR2L9J0_9EUKA